MITKQDIVEMARRVTRRGENMPDRRLMHPHRDWLIGLVVAIILAGMGIAYNAHLFRHYGSLETKTVGSEPAFAEYKQGTVERVLEMYGARRASFDAFRASLPAAPAATEEPAAVETDASDPIVAE